MDFVINLCTIWAFGEESSEIKIPEEHMFFNGF